VFFYNFFSIIKILSVPQVAAAVRGQTADILAKSHKMKKNWKKILIERICYNF